jgi:hypothetical protein
MKYFLAEIEIRVIFAPAFADVRQAKTGFLPFYALASNHLQII